MGKSKHTVLLCLFLLGTIGKVMAYDCGSGEDCQFTYDPNAYARTSIGVSDWRNNDYGRITSEDSTSSPDPSASVNESLTITSPVNLGTFSGGGSASTKNLAVKLSLPATPNTWNPDINNMNTGSSAEAAFTEYFYYKGSGVGKITYRFNITGTIEFSDPNYIGPPIQMDTRLSLWNRYPLTFPYTTSDNFEIIFDDYWPDTWGGTDFYKNYNFNYEFGLTVDYEFGVENMSYLQLATRASFLEPGTPAVTVDFSNTVTYYVEKLIDPIGQEMNLIDPETGVLLLEAATGANYSVPIPGAVWLLGSGLIGLVGFRKKFKK